MGTFKKYIILLINLFLFFSFIKPLYPYTDDELLNEIEKRCAMWFWDKNDPAGQGLPMTPNSGYYNDPGQSWDSTSSDAGTGLGWQLYVLPTTEDGSDL